MSALADLVPGPTAPRTCGNLQESNSFHLKLLHMVWEIQICELQHKRAAVKFRRTSRNLVFHTVA